MPNKIVIGLYTGRTCMASFTMNVANMVEHLVRTGEYAGLIHRQSSRVDSNRNYLIADFLERYPQATHLYIIDDDMLHPPVSASLLAARDLPIVTGLYFRRDYNGHYAPVVYKNAGKDIDTRRGHGNHANDHFVPLTPHVMEFLKNSGAPLTNKPFVFYQDADHTPMDSSTALLPIDGGGFGCIMLRRDTLEQISPPYLLDEPGLNGDLVFYRNARNLGIEIYCDMSVICAHNLDGEYIGMEAFSKHCWELDKEMRERFAYTEDGTRV